LIVDDEPDVRAVVRSMLDGELFDPVWEAPDGESAIQIAFQQHPDLIVLDYRLPGINGEAVANGLKVLAAKTQILVLTSVLRSAPSWGDGYLDKLEIDRLPEVLELMMKSRLPRRRRHDD
jgi:CheY-like chemotaxis protein